MEFKVGDTIRYTDGSYDFEADITNRGCYICTNEFRYDLRITKVFKSVRNNPQVGYNLTGMTSHSFNMTLRHNRNNANTVQHTQRLLKIKIGFERLIETGRRLGRWLQDRLENSQKNKRFLKS